jgi:hypothetical protein
MNKAIANSAIVVAIVLITLFAYSYYTMETSTQITITSVKVYSCGKCYYKSDGAWRFSVTVNGTTVYRGETVQLSANLTNISGRNQVIFNRFPQAYVAIVYLNRSLAWAYQPPSATWPNVTILAGESNTFTVNVPTSNLYVKNSYILLSQPSASNYPSDIPIGNGLGINITFSVN